MGPAKLCINVSRQTWAFALPPKEDFRMLLRSFTALFVREPYLYTTEILQKELEKEQRTLCKGFTNKNFKYILSPGQMSGQIRKIDVYG